MIKIADEIINNITANGNERISSKAFDVEGVKEKLIGILEQSYNEPVLSGEGFILFVVEIAQLDFFCLL